MEFWTHVGLDPDPVDLGEVPSLKFEHFSPLKINGWKMSFLFEPGLFGDFCCQFQGVCLYLFLPERDIETWQNCYMGLQLFNFGCIFCFGAWYHDDRWCHLIYLLVGLVWFLLWPDTKVSRHLFFQNLYHQPFSCILGFYLHVEEVL